MTGSSRLSANLTRLVWSILLAMLISVATGCGDSAIESDASDPPTTQLGADTTAPAAPTASTTAATSAPTTAAPTTSTTEAWVPYAPDELFIDGAFEVSPFGLQTGDLPAGFTFAEGGDITVLEGCTATSSYCRFQQILEYPPDTHLHGGLRTVGYKMTMQGVVTSDQSTLDTYVEDLFAGQSANTAHALQGDFDLYGVLYPAARVRTEGAVFFLVSERMEDGTNCNTAADCDEYFADGRSLDPGELSILAAYQQRFEQYTGPTIDEWRWSYGP